MTRRPGRTRPSIRPRTRETAAPEAGRRGLNILVAVVGLVIAMPVMLVIAALIKLTSRGPIFYTQTRVGLDRRGRPSNPDLCRRAANRGGQPFPIYKFRTMSVARASEVSEQWATPDDPRVTPLGRVLRRYRLDELPQLFNVLKGDMNIVGPRPEQPTIFAHLRERIDGYEKRQSVPPGITGWAQVNQAYDASLDDVRRKVSLDLEYIERQSVSEDLRIMVKTVPTILFRKGAW